MEMWNPTGLFQDSSMPHIFAIVLITIILFILGFIYFIQTKNTRPTDEPKNYSIIVDSIILAVKKMVVDSFGPKFAKATPYFLFLFLFLCLSNIIGIFGIKEPSTSYTFPLTLALITWITSITMAVKYQKLSYLKKFCFKIKIKGNDIPVMLNPLEIIGEITPLISLSFRLWGNMFAGMIIYSVIFWALSSISSSMPAIIIVILGGVVLMPFLLLYFSLFIGAVQAYVFTLLSITYISRPIIEGEEIQIEKELRKNERLERKKMMNNQKEK